MHGRRIAFTAMATLFRSCAIRGAGVRETLRYASNEHI
jgi:hypothetical protein